MTSLSRVAAVAALVLSLVPAVAVSQVPPVSARPLTVRPQSVAPSSGVSGVVNGTDGLPAAGVTITARTAPEVYCCDAFWSGRTGGDGRYTISGLAAGVYWLFADGGLDYQDGVYAHAQAMVVVPVGTVLTAPTITLERAGRIEGRTVNAAGIGIRSVVRVSTPWRLQVPDIVYGQNGRFTIGGLPAGGYYVWSEGAGRYAPQAYRGSSSFRNLTKVGVRANAVTRLATMVLRLGAVVSARVVTSSGRPLARATVTATATVGSVRVTRTCRTGTTGRCALAGLPAGAISVRAAIASRWMPSRRTVTGYLGRTTSARLALTVREAVISGTATATNGARIAGLPVHLSRWVLSPNPGQEIDFRVTRTTSTGTYRFGLLPLGTYRVEFGSLDGDGPSYLATQSARLALRPGTSAVVNARLKPGGTISGLVTDQDGDPIAGAVVQIRHRPDPSLGYRRAETGADGRYRIAGLETDDYSVTFKATGHTDIWWRQSENATGAVLLPVVAGTTATDVDAQLTAFALITGVVRAPDLTLLPWVEGTLTEVPPGTRTYRVLCGSDARFVLSGGLLPGTYTLTMQPPYGRTDLVPTSYADGTPITLAAGDVRVGLDVTMKAAP